MLGQNATGLNQTNPFCKTIQPKTIIYDYAYLVTKQCCHNVQYLSTQVFYPSHYHGYYPVHVKHINIAFYAAYRFRIGAVTTSNSQVSKNTWKMIHQCIHFLIIMLITRCHCTTPQQSSTSGIDINH